MPNDVTLMSLRQIRNWFLSHRRTLSFNADIPTISEIAKRAGISRQTLYALIRDDRSEFGTVAQMRISRVIQQINLNPAYPQIRSLSIDLSHGVPRLRIGGQH